MTTYSGSVKNVSAVILPVQKIFNVIYTSKKLMFILVVYLPYVKVPTSLGFMYLFIFSLYSEPNEISSNCN